MHPKYAHGGIGDLLQFLEDAIEEKNIDLYSHFDKAPEIFQPFDIHINRFELFDTLENSLNMYCPGERLKRNYHSKFTVPTSPIPKQKGITIGIHVEGSKFSNDFWSRQGLPTKNMSEKFMKSLVKVLQEEYPKAKFYFFCSPHRRDEIGQLMAPIVNGDYFMIAFDKIWDTLSCVLHCDYVIGMDSAIKSMAAIHSIPSTVLVGNYPDPFRDENFLTPYIKEGIMNVLSFNDINLVDIQKILNNICKIL